MTQKTKTPLYRDEDHELLGYVVFDGSNWQAQTIFGYTLSRDTTRESIERYLHEHGLSSLMGIWQYYDKDDQDWFPCVIKEAFEHKVIVNRTNVLGYLDPDDRKQVLIEDPTENNLVKS